MNYFFIADSDRVKLYMICKLYLRENFCYSMELQMTVSTNLKSQIIWPKNQTEHALD